MMIPNMYRPDHGHGLFGPQAGPPMGTAPVSPTARKPRKPGVNTPGNSLAAAYHKAVQDRFHHRP